MVAGPVSYKVKMSLNLILRCHIDQLRTRYGHSNEDTVTHNNLDNWTFPLSIESNTFTPITTYLPTLHLLNLSQFVVPFEFVELLTDMVHRFLS